MRQLLFSVLALTCILLVPLTTQAANTYDMTTSSNWNIRFDGAEADNGIGAMASRFVDINQNGVPDLIISNLWGGFNGRTGSGSVYVVYDSLLASLAASGTGNTIDLANASNYNLRFDGANASDQLGVEGVTTGDFDSDGKLDLAFSAIVADFNSRSASGSVFVIYNTLFDNYTGTGNNIDLATSSNYNLRFDGPAANCQFGYQGTERQSGDFDKDGKIDLAIGSSCDYSASNTGSLFLIFNTTFSGYSGTGNNIDLATSSNYNIRIDGAAANDRLGAAQTTTTMSSYAIGDLDNDGYSDIVVGADGTDYNSRNASGSLYIFYNTLLDNYSGTGNTFSVSTTSNFNIRIDGAAAVNQLGQGAIKITDFNQDGESDLFAAFEGGDFNSRTNSGSVYYFDQDIFSNLSGTANLINLSNDSSFTFRIDGATGDALGGLPYLSLADYNNDSLTDILIPAKFADYNSRSNSGSGYVISNSILFASSTIGRTFDLASSTNYSLRFDGTTSESFSSAGLVDLNSDGMNDFIFTGNSSNNSRALSGSLYIVYNFPHTFTNTSVTPTSNSIIYKGTINASNSVTAISGVQYQVDGNSPSSGWSSCTADDGSFNSTSEAYTCQSGTVSNGSHTIYVRSYDTNTSYTAQSSYGTRTVSIGDSNTTISGTNDAPQITQSSNGGNASGGAMSPVRDSSTNGQQIKIILEPNTFNFSAFVSAQSSTPITGYGALLVNPITGTTPKIGTKTNAVLAGTKLGVRTNGGVAWQVGNLQQIWYKAYAPAGSDKSPAKIIPELQKKQSIVALSYTDANLIPPGRPKSKFNNKTLKLAHSVDGITWKILPTSVVDTKNRTVAALHKIGGYYMVVGR